MAEGSASLDTLLTDAGGGATRRWFPGVAGAKLAARLATRPWKVARRGAGYGGELAKIAVGQSDVAPSKKDRRFKDEAWRGNPAFRRLAQVYLAAGQDGRRADLRRRPRRALRAPRALRGRERPRRAGADELPGDSTRRR